VEARKQQQPLASFQNDVVRRSAISMTRCRYPHRVYSGVQKASPSKG
jgi:hypothetical protein